MKETTYIEKIYSVVRKMINSALDKMERQEYYAHIPIRAYV